MPYKWKATNVILRNNFCSAVNIIHKASSKGRFNSNSNSDSQFVAEARLKSNESSKQEVRLWRVSNCDRWVVTWNLQSTSHWWAQLIHNRNWIFIKRHSTIQRCCQRKSVLSLRNKMVFKHFRNTGRERQINVPTREVNIGKTFRMSSSPAQTGNNKKVSGSRAERPGSEAIEVQKVSRYQGATQTMFHQNEPTKFKL